MTSPGHTHVTDPATNVFLADVLAQPQLLGRLDLGTVVASARPLLEDAAWRRRIILTGMGGSHAALGPLWLSLVSRGQPAWRIETSEALASCLPLIDRNTLVIVASQSGRSGEIVLFADEATARGGRILAVTNDRTSPLAARAGAVVDIGAGPEAAVSTKTFVNTIGACIGLRRAVLGEGVDDVLVRAGEAIDRYLETARSRIDAIKAAIGLPERLVILGRGPSLSIADYGALVAKEAAKRPVESLGAAEFRHGPMELVDDRLTVVMLPGGDERDRTLNASLARDVARLGGKVHLIDTGHPGAPLAMPEVPAAARQIGEAIPLQLLAIALAELSGVEAGVFRHLEKVTTTL